MWHRIANKKTSVLILLIFLSAAIYLNAINNTFHYDDLHHIRDNPHIKDIKHIPLFFINIETFSGLAWAKNYRPILLLTHAINYAIGGLNPVGYHLVNLAFHIGSAFLVFLIVQAILGSGDKVAVSQGISHPSTFWDAPPYSTFFKALAAALIFVVHPFNSEVINYISARSSVMASFFYLLAFYYWVKYREKGASPFYIASLLAFLLGMLTKEILITLPVMLWFYDLYFVPGDGQDRQSRFVFHIKRLSAYLPFVLFVAIPYTLMRLYLTRGVTSHMVSPRSYYVNLLTEAKVLIKYIQLLFLPVNLSVEHYIAESYSVLEWQVAGSIFLIILLLSLCVWLYYSRNRDWRLLSFFIVWFFIVMLPTTIIPLNAILQENRGYLSGISFTVTVSLLIGGASSLSFFSKWSGSRLSVAAYSTLLLIIIFYGVGTFERNRVWKDPVSLWADAVRHAPLSSRAHHNLAFSYSELGMTGDAIVEYQKALELDSKDHRIHYNLGNIYVKLGLKNLAIYEYNLVLELDPAAYKAHNNLGMVYKEMGDIEIAAAEFKKAISINPRYVQAHLNLGRIYAHIGETDLSYREFEIAKKIALSAGKGAQAKEALEEMENMQKGVNDHVISTMD